MQGGMGFSVSATNEYQSSMCAQPPLAFSDCRLLGGWRRAVEDGHEPHGAERLEPPRDGPSEAAKPGMPRSCPTHDAILACTMACATHLEPARRPASRRSSSDSAAAARYILIRNEVKTRKHASWPAYAQYGRIETESLPCEILDGPYPPAPSRRA